MVPLWGGGQFCTTDVYGILLFVGLRFENILKRINNILTRNVFLSYYGNIQLSSYCLSSKYLVLKGPKLARMSEKIQNMHYQIEKGALDNLVRLRVFDIRDNVDTNFDGDKEISRLTISSYTTTSWNFCHRIANQNLETEGGLTFFQDYVQQTQESLKNY